MESNLRRVACAAVVGALLMMGVGSPGAAGAVTSEPRAYELVSPPEKDGGDAMPVPMRTRAAADGNALAFTGLTAFGDALGVGVTAEYMSRRDGAPQSNGWATHALMPQLDPFSPDTITVAGFDTLYLGEFSDDLHAGILRTGTNLSGDPNLGAVANLYLRTDLLTPGAGSYETVTLCPACVSPFGASDQTGTAALADATPDFGHVLFETRLNLVPGTSGDAQKAYEWDHGVVRLAGVLPQAMGGGPAPASIVGIGAVSGSYTLRTLSDDGRRIIFTDNSTGTDGRNGVVYMRIDHATTVQLNASERTDCADHDPCTGDPEADPNGTKPGRFETASADGTKVFFISDEQLTDAHGSGLYLYDADLPDSDPHNLTLIGSGEIRGAIGASADGTYVYFLADGSVEGTPPIAGGSFGVYVWHANAVRLIGSLANPGRDESENWLGGFYGLVPLGSRVTPDGLHVVFTSHSGQGLTGYNQSIGCGAVGCAELYLYSYDADSLACASCNPSGAPATGDAGFTQYTGNGASQAIAHLTHALSDDGRYVFFTSGERLAAQDRNGTKRDAYVYDATTGSVQLLSSGKSADDSLFLDASVDGRDAFFATRERLVGWDVDSAYDIYDARIGGGFPEPVPASGECVADACQGAARLAPDAETPLTSTFVAGSDNLKQVRKATHKRIRCKPGQMRKRVHGRVKCVKRKHATRHRGTR